MAIKGGHIIDRATLEKNADIIQHSELQLTSFWRRSLRPSCRGRITGNDWRDPALHQKYGTHFVPYILDKIQAVGPATD